MTFHQIVLQRKQCQITCYSSSYTNGREVTGNFAKPVLKLDFLFNLLAEVRLQGERMGQVAFLSWSRARETLRSNLVPLCKAPGGTFPYLEQFLTQLLELFKVMALPEAASFTLLLAI